MFTVSQEPIAPKEVLALLRTVPEWFGRPESNREYIKATQNLPCWVARINQQVVGVAAIQKHSVDSWEIHLMVVERGFHRMGIGRALIKEIEEQAQMSKVSLSQADIALVDNVWFRLVSRVMVRFCGLGCCVSWCLV
ncbi:GNAT family N-acetyltransferase [Rothia sp. P5764]|uniref:GNAT family N-acetyltransferase n=1 Tax=Rothia sp. P5764 TaxID=3402654 RepID=UPI003ABFBF57